MQNRRFAVPAGSISGVFGGIRRLGEAANSRRGTTVLAAAAGVIFLGAVLGAYLTRGDGKSATPPISTATTSTVPAKIEGFAIAAMTVRDPQGETSDHCVLVADTPERQARGLMKQTGLGGYDAMVFAFPADVRSSFYTFDVGFPLSIAWFGGDGTYLSGTDMPTCPLDQAHCPLYASPVSYRYAVETQAGGMTALGIAQGSSISVGGACA